MLMHEKTCVIPILKNDIFKIFFLCGGYLSQVRKNAKYLDFNEDCMFGLTLAITYFQFVTN